MIDKKLKNILLISLFLLIFSIGVFYKTLFNGEIFAWYNDQLFQHNVFYKEWHQIIRESISSHTLAIYSWNTFLGTDYLASKLMYCVGDFLITLFFILYSGEINYDLLFCITTIISIVLSGINMYVYLNKLDIRKDYLLIMLSIIYALGGFVMTYTGTYTFHRFYCLLPLLFYFCESYIKNNKTFGFAIIVALLFMQNYELLFSTCFFLVLYFIIRYRLDSEFKLIDILKKAIPLIISFLIGIALVGIFLIPLILYIKGNSRIGSIDTSFIWNFKQILGFISSLVVPAFNYRSGNPSYMFYSSEHYGSEYGCFSTILFILTFIILLKEGNKKERCLLSGELIILLCLFIKPINSIIHGFSVSTFRWSFILEFYHLFVVAYVFNKYEIKHSYLKCINILYGVYIVLYVIFILVYKLDIKEYGLSLIINILCFGLLYIYYFLYKNSHLKLFTIFGILNISIFYILSIYSVYGIYGVGGTSYNKEYLTYLIDTDEDRMFRIYFDSDTLWPYSWLNLNDSINNGYMSVTTYDSTYNSILNDFLNSNGYTSWMIDIDDYDLLRMLGVKYYVTSETIDDVNLEYYTNLDNYNVYEIRDYHHIGYVDDSELNIVEYNRQYFKGEISVNKDCTLFVSIPYSEGWNVYDEDGNKLDTVNINGGFMGVNINSGVHELSFYYGTPGLKKGACLSALGFIGLVYLFVKDKKLIA